MELRRPPKRHSAAPGAPLLPCGRPRRARRKDAWDNTTPRRTRATCWSWGGRPQIKPRRPDISNSRPPDEHLTCRPRHSGGVVASWWRQRRPLVDMPAEFAVRRDVAPGASLIASRTFRLRPEQRLRASRGREPSVFPRRSNPLDLRRLRPGRMVVRPATNVKHRAKPAQDIAWVQGRKVRASRQLPSARALVVPGAVG